MLFDEINQELDDLKRFGLLRSRKKIEAISKSKILIDSKWLINFSSNDYLGMSQNKSVQKSIILALKHYGNGSGASHLISGHSKNHELLESLAAKITGMQRGLFFSSGYMANLAVLSGLCNRNTTIFSDKLNHASLNEAAILSRAKFIRYQHLDLDHLELHIKKDSNKRKLIVTDGVFSMDGDIADIPGLVYLCKKYDAKLFIDDAHGYGILGHSGQGILEHYEDLGFKENELRSLIIYMFTLGKSIGVAGAIICASEDIIEYLIQKSKSYVYTTASPAYIASGALTSISITKLNQNLREKSKSLIDLFRSKLYNKTALTTSQTPIQPILIGDVLKAVKISKQLLELGFFVPVIRPPTVPIGTSRLRVSISALHSKSDIIKLTSSLNNLLKE